MTFFAAACIALIVATFAYLCLRFAAKTAGMGRQTVGVALFVVIGGAWIAVIALAINAVVAWYLANV